MHSGGFFGKPVGFGVINLLLIGYLSGKLAGFSPFLFFSLYFQKSLLPVPLLVFIFVSKTWLLSTQCPVKIAGFGLSPTKQIQSIVLGKTYLKVLLEPSSKL